MTCIADVEEGGETVFPNGKWLDDEVESAYKAQGMSECARQGVAVKPRKGDALLFWSLTPGGERVWEARVGVGAGAAVGARAGAGPGATEGGGAAQCL